MSTTITLITAEEYARMPDMGRPTELVRGRIVELNVPAPRHGFVCGNIAGNLWRFVRENDLGRVFSNDSGVITEHDPDTVRGPDVWYASYAKLPKGKLPGRYLDVVPDIAIEVLSPDDRWSKVLANVAEYLNAGVPVVCVVDPEEETARLFHPDEPSSPTLSADDDLTFPEVLPGFSVRVGSLFE
jgi:Uma2 family endonuclease